ncbi:MAG: RNA pyrophosphohydrolase [Alphaproteobacteria bacterium]
MNQISPERDDALYRPCVGIALFNPAGLVFVGERLDNRGAWQMPQGGIDAGEDIHAAAFREMEEEIGTRSARLLGVIDDWIYYDIPPHTAQKLWNNRYRGQRQKWVAMAFTGSDADIRLDAFSHPEFAQWKWVPLTALLDHAVPFKRDVYSRVMAEFEPFARHLGA